MLHEILVPEHPPLHPAKVEPVSSVAVSVATAPEEYAWEQSDPQLITGVVPVSVILVTVPTPLPVRPTANVCSVKVSPPTVTVEAASNAAMTVLLCVMVTVHVVAVPEQPPPPHPINVEPDAGAASRVIAVPVTIDSEQSVNEPLLPQLMPVAVIDPVPVSFTSITVSNEAALLTFVNSAVTVRACVMETVHVDVPPHTPPLHPANVAVSSAVVAGIAVRETDVPVV